MKLLTSCLILFNLFLTVPGFGQEINDVWPESEQDEMKCSHISHYLSANGKKSIINPNPHVFDYDVKFYKLDIEAYDTTSQFKGSATVLAEVVVAETDTFSIELSNKLSADSCLY